MNGPQLLSVLAAIALLLLAALLSASLSAINAVSGARARTLKDEGFDGADDLLALRGGDRALAHWRSTRLLILLGAAVFVSFALVDDGQGIQLGFFGGVALIAAGAGFATVLLLLLLGYRFPAALARRRPVGIALRAAPALRSAGRLVHALLGPLDRFESLLFGSSGVGSRAVEEQQMRETLEIGADEGMVEAEEHRLVERAFRLDELTARDAMTPRVGILAWPESRPLKDAIREFPDVPYSRVPLFGENIDDIQGILSAREAYQAHSAGEGNAPLSSLARDPIFVPGSLSLSKLLELFRTRRVHMGIVADEFGGTDGLITLEDVLEELVGDIVDETDVDETLFVRVSENELVAQGSVDLREINDQLNVQLPAGENRSLNGLLLEEFGAVPPSGTTIETAGTRITILEASETHVVKARLIRAGGPAKN